MPVYGKRTIKKYPAHHELEEALLWLHSQPQCYPPMQQITYSAAPEAATLRLLLRLANGYGE